jgi:hypothetical protein
MRANYGVGIVAGMFGAKPFLMPYETNTLPNVYPIEGGAEGIRRLLDENTSLTESITMQDYAVGPVTESCFDLFYIAHK